MRIIQKVLGNEIVDGDLWLRKTLNVVAESRTAIIYEYDGKLLKYFKEDGSFDENEQRMLATILFKKMRNLRMFCVPRALYYEDNKYSGVIIDRLSGKDLQESLGVGSCISSKIISGYYLSKDLEDMHDMNIIWGDIHLSNIILCNDGNCYGIDVDQVYRSSFSIWPFNLYDVVNLNIKKRNVNALKCNDTAKLIISMASYILGCDLQKIVVTFGIEDTINILHGTKILEYVRDVLKIILNDMSLVYYHDMVDKLLSFDSDEYQDSSNEVKQILSLIR